MLNYLFFKQRCHIPNEAFDLILVVENENFTYTKNQNYLGKKGITYKRLNNKKGK